MHQVIFIDLPTRLSI